METVQKKGLTPVQKEMFLQLMLILCIGGAVSTLLHKPMLMVLMLGSGWLFGILILSRGPIGYMYVVRSALAMIAVYYILFGLVMPWWPA